MRRAGDRCRLHSSEYATGWRSGYWPFATIVVGLGIVAFAWQLLLLGLALLVLGPFRDRRLVFWPAIAAVVVFGLGCVRRDPHALQGVDEDTCQGQAGH